MRHQRDAFAVGAVAVLLALSPDSVAAQTASIGPVLREARASHRLLRIHLDSGVVKEGRVASVRGASLRLQSDPEAIDTAWVTAIEQRGRVPDGNSRSVTGSLLLVGIALPFAGLLAIVNGAAAATLLVLALAVGSLGGAALDEAGGGETSDWSVIWTRVPPAVPAPAER